MSRALCLFSFNLLLSLDDEGRLEDELIINFLTLTLEYRNSILELRV